MRWQRIVLAIGVFVFGLPLNTRYQAVAAQPDPTNPIDVSQANIIAWSPTGEYLATGHLGGVALWDGETGALVAQYPLNIADYPNAIPNVFALAWKPDGQQLAVRLGFADTWTFIRTLAIPTGTTVVDDIDGGLVLGLDWSPDGTRLAVPFTRSVVYDAEIRIHDANDGQLLQTLPAPDRATLGAVHWSPDGTRLAVAFALNTEAGLIVWDMNGDNEQSVLPNPTPISSFDWSPEGSQIAATDADFVLHIWDVTTGRVIGLFNNAPMLNVDWHPFENVLGLEYDKGVAILDAETGSVSYEIEQATRHVKWSPDGLRLATFAATPQFVTREGQLLPQFPSIFRCTLTDTSSETLIVTVKNGSTVEYNAIGNPGNLTIRCFTPSELVQSMVFDLNNQQMVDNEAPFEIPLPAPGEYTLTGVPYTELNGQGQAGTPLTIRFTVRGDD